MKDRFYSFNSYLKDKFGEKVQRISINAGFNCPNLDGRLSKDGCIYCNNEGFSKYAISDLSIEEQIKESITYYENRLGARKFIAYFQSYSNTYADVLELEKKYDTIRKFPQIVGLFISTRPDCIDKEKIELISQYKKDYLVWLEYGLQTTHNHILKIINRNHTYEDFLCALELSRHYEINVGIHIIIGLPQTNQRDIIDDAGKLSQLDIQGIKFHILHIFKNTHLEKMYQENKINLLSKEEYIKIICDFLERIPSSMVILRLISTASGGFLTAPLWINQKQEVIADIKKELEKRGTHQGFLSK